MTEPTTKELIAQFKSIGTPQAMLTVYELERQLRNEVKA